MLWLGVVHLDIPLRVLPAPSCFCFSCYCFPCVWQVSSHYCSAVLSFICPCCWLFHRSFLFSVTPLLATLQFSQSLVFHSDHVFSPFHLAFYYIPGKQTNRLSTMGVDHGGMRGMHTPYDRSGGGGWPVQSSPPPYKGDEQMK